MSTTTRTLLTQFAESSHYAISKASTPGADGIDGEHFRCLCARAAYAGAAAYLLAQLIERAPEHVDDIASQLDAMLADGGDLAEWVAGRVGDQRAEEIAQSAEAETTKEATHA